MRKTRNLIVLLVILVLLIGAVLLTGKKNDDSSDRKTTTPKTTAKSKAVTIFDYDQKMINKISIQNEDKLLTFNKQNGTWKTATTKFSIDQASIDSIASNMSQLSSDRTINPNKDLSIYGLKPAKAIITASLTDGVQKVLYLGDKTPGNEGYYFTVPNDKHVYTMFSSYGDSFNISLSAIIKKNNITLSQDTIKAMQIIQPGKPLTSIKKRTNIDPTLYAQIDGSFYMDKPYSEQLGVSDDKFGKLFPENGQITVSDMVSEDTTNLKKYGLATPSLKLVIANSQNKTTELLFGDRTNDGNVYFKYGNSNAVYTVSSTDIDKFRVSPMDLLTRFVSIVMIDDVDRIVLNTPNRKDDIKIERVKSGKKTKTTYLVNGKKMGKENFKDLYQRIIALSVDSENDKKSVSGPVEASLTYYLNKGESKKIHVNFIPYNDDLYIVQRNDEENFVIDRKKFKDLVKDIDKFSSKK